MADQASGPEFGRWDPLSICPPGRIHLLEEYNEMVGDLNRRVNLVSRESVGERWERHILHSLCLGWRAFPAGARVVDWGTGGGLPCIPLGIAFPEVRFVGVDAVGKKVMAVRTMVRRLGLENVEAVHARAEEWDGAVDYSVSRATAPLSTLWGWHVRVAQRGVEPREGFWPRGLVCLKGGDLGDEASELQSRWRGVHTQVFPLADVAAIPEFVGKHIVVVTSRAE